MTFCIFPVYLHSDIPDDIDINEDELAALLLETQKTLRNLQEKARTSVQKTRESADPLSTEGRKQRRTYLMVKQGMHMMWGGGGSFLCRLEEESIIIFIV
jgi:hypothetical protein